MEFGENLTTIGERAFAMCVSLKEVDLPDSLTSIQYGSFGCCINLNKLVIGKGLKTIDDVPEKLRADVEKILNS